MRVYLDNCCYNRPFDDQSQDRIHIESEAVLAVLKACESGLLTVLSSPVVRMEIDKAGYGDYTKEKYVVPEEDAQTVYEQLKKY